MVTDEDPRPCAEGVKTFDDDDAVAYVWAVFWRRDVAAVLAEYEEGADIAAALCGWRRHYSGPGRSFADEPRVRIGRNRVLVTQRRGLDI